MNAASLPQIDMMRAIDAIGARVVPALHQDDIARSPGTEGVPAGGARAPLIEPMSKLPKGSGKGILDRMKTSAIGDFKPIRTSLPQPPLSYRRAVALALFQEDL